MKTLHKTKPFKRLSPESEKREKENMQTLAGIQVPAIVLMQDMQRNFLPRFIEICMETWRNSKTLK